MDVDVCKGTERCYESWDQNLFLGQLCYQVTNKSCDIYVHEPVSSKKEREENTKNYVIEHSYGG